MKLRHVTSLLCMALMLSACVNQSVDPGVEESGEMASDTVGDTAGDAARGTAGSKEQEVTVALANPAALHCEEHGYELVNAKMDNGSALMCVDVATGSKCPVWKYFRGECDLPEPDS